MSIPHHFPSLVDGTAQTVLIAGAGLSAQLATVSDLEGKLEGVARKLGLPATDGSAVEFYKLADATLKKLIENGRSDAESRLFLAEELGLLDDRRWFGDISVPL